MERIIHSLLNFAKTGTFLLLHCLFRLLVDSPRCSSAPCLSSNSCFDCICSLRSAFSDKYFYRCFHEAVRSVFINMSLNIHLCGSLSSPQDKRQQTLSAVNSHCSLDVDSNRLFNKPTCNVQMFQAFFQLNDKMETLAPFYDAFFIGV